MRDKINAKECIILLIGIFFVSISIYYIMMPSHLVMGTLSGLILVLANFIPLSVSALTLIANLILLIIGFIFIGKEFGTKTVIASLLLPLYLRIFEIITPDVPPLTDDIVVNLFCFILVISLGQAMLFNINASSGGMDIIAKLMNKFFHMNLGKSLALCGFVVSSTSILVYDKNILIVSLLGTYLSGVVLDYFIDGAHMRKRVTIISPDYEEIQQFIVKKLKRGATLYEVRGAWDNCERIQLMTILQKNEYKQLINFVYSVDPVAFVTVSNVGEVIGRWNPHIRKIDMNM